MDEVILLQSNVNSEITINKQYAQERIMTLIDPTMISQALNNLIKNALESINSATKNKVLKKEKNGLIKIAIISNEKNIIIKIQDNGIGLPKKKSQLFEPYVTSRENGIGLGLAILKKIIE